MLSGANSAGVVGHAQIVEEQASVFVELADFLSDRFRAFRLDQANSKAAQAGDVLRAVTGTDAATIFVKVPIENVVAAVFDGPVAAVDIEEALGIGLLGRAAGDAVGEIAGRVASFLVDHDPFDEKDLADKGEVEIAVEFGRGPDVASFDATMMGRIDVDEVRLFSIVEEQHQIVEQRGLVGFDDEVVVGLSLIDQVVGEFALGQKGIGGDISVFKIEAVEERDGHADLVGLF